jgi:hypothetical protein
MTRKEDFLTEIFAYLLENDEVFFKIVIDKFFKIKNQAFLYEQTTVETQQSVGDGSIDLKLTSGSENIIFIENKIDAGWSRENQMSNFLKEVSNYKHGELFLIKSISNSLTIPKDIKDVDRFKGPFYWQDLFELLKEIKNRPLITAFMDLFNNHEFRLSPEKPIKSISNKDQICRVLNSVCEMADVKHTTQSISNNYEPQFTNHKSISGGTSNILFHSFGIKPIINPYNKVTQARQLTLGEVHLITLFKKSGQYKTNLKNGAVIAFMYTFWQTKIDDEGKLHSTNLFNQLNNSLEEDDWKEEIKPSIEDTAQKIKKCFKKISQDSLFSSIIELQNNKSEVTAHHDAVILPIAYTADKISQFYQDNDGLKEYYCSLLQMLVKMSNKYSLFKIIDDFYLKQFYTILKKRN